MFYCLLFIRMNHDRDTQDKLSFKETGSEIDDNLPELMNRFTDPRSYVTAVPNTEKGLF